MLAGMGGPEKREFLKREAIAKYDKEMQAAMSGIQKCMKEAAALEGRLNGTKDTQYDKIKNMKNLSNPNKTA